MWMVAYLDVLVCLRTCVWGWKNDFWEKCGGGIYTYIRTQPIRPPPIPLNRALHRSMHLHQGRAAPNKHLCIHIYLCYLMSHNIHFTTLRKTPTSVSYWQNSLNVAKPPFVVFYTPLPLKKKVYIYIIKINFKGIDTLKNYKQGSAIDKC